MSFVIWLTGLSGSGKSTIATELKTQLGEGLIIDGDVLRGGLCHDLGFSADDRTENVRRATELAKIAAADGTPAIVALISPGTGMRRDARALVAAAGLPFYEVHVATPLDVCEERDVKGLYAKARSGEIPDFTGVSPKAPYETPENPELVLQTEGTTPAQCAGRIRHLVRRADVAEPHLCFIGRWTPFHLGHWEIMKRTAAKEPGKALNVLVRATSTDAYPATVRKRMVEYSLRSMGIPHTVQIIANTHALYYGRGVGWAPREIEVEAGLASISATKIRQMQTEGDDGWKKLVAPGVDEFIEAEQL